MSFIATFRHGKPVMIDHTPESAISAGDVVMVQDEPRIAHKDIAAGELGALAAGGGVYDVDKAAVEIADGVTLYWDESAEKVTTDDDSAANKIWGRSAAAATSEATQVRALHDPSANGS